VGMHHANHSRSDLGKHKSPTIDLFLSYQTDITRPLKPSNDFTVLNGWIGKCVRL